MNPIARPLPLCALFALVLVFGLAVVGLRPTTAASNIAKSTTRGTWVFPGASTLITPDNRGGTRIGALARGDADRRGSDSRVEVNMTGRQCALSRKRVVADGVVFFTVTNYGSQAQAFSIHNKRSRLVGARKRTTLRVFFGRTHRFHYNCAPRHPRRWNVRRGRLLVVMASESPPAPGPPPGSAWKATTESGNLNEWSAERGGGEYNSGRGDSGASQTVAHTGSWSARQEINTSSGSSGTRLFRWREYRTLVPGQPATTSVWVYIPARPRIGGYFNLFQFKSKTQSGSYIDVFFQLNLFNRSDGSLYLRAAWGCGAENPNFPHGPYASSQGLCKFFPPLATVNVPIGKWFEIRSRIVPSNRYTGSIKFWQNGVLLYDFHDVMTGYPNTNSVNGVDTQWAVNAYANGLSPSSYVHYVDDATVARG